MLAIASLEMTRVIYYILIVVFIINYVVMKEFRVLIHKIKKIALSPRKANKAILIKNELSKYFFD